MRFRETEVSCVYIIQKAVMDPFNMWKNSAEVTKAGAKDELQRMRTKWSNYKFRLIARRVTEQIINDGSSADGVNP